MIERGNKETYNKWYRECMHRGLVFVFIQYSSSSRKYASIHYDLWPVEFNLTEEAAGTIRELMRTATNRSLNDPIHRKKESIWLSNTVVSGLIHWILVKYAEELALAIEQVILNESNQIAFEYSREARSKVKFVGSREKYEVKING